MRRFIDRRRRTLAATLLCLGAGTAVYQLTPPSTALVPVVVAARDLAGGTTVSSGDLRIARLPAEAVPQRAESEASKIVGQRLAGPLRGGEVFTDAAVVGPGLLAGTSPGTSAVPVRMADPGSLQLLSPGQLVDLVLSAETGSAASTASAGTTLASRVPVLWTGKSGASGQAGAWLGPSQDSEGLLVVGASTEQALRIAGASTRGKVFFMLVDAGPR